MVIAAGLAPDPVVTALGLSGVKGRVKADACMRLAGHPVVGRSVTWPRSRGWPAGRHPAADVRPAIRVGHSAAPAGAGGGSSRSGCRGGAAGFPCSSWGVFASPSAPAFAPSSSSFFSATGASPVVHFSRVW